MYLSMSNIHGKKYVKDANLMLHVSVLKPRTTTYGLNSFSYMYLAAC